MTRRSSVARVLVSALLAAAVGACAPTYATREVNHKEIALERPSAPMGEKDALAVRIETFDPGKLPEDRELAKGLSMEIRNAEAHYLPVQLRNAMQRSGYWGPVRVVPKGTREGEVVVSGRIVNSDGEILKLEISVRDSRGVEWFTKEYETVVSEEIYTTAQQQGVDAFQPIFNEIANDIAAYKRTLPPKAPATIQKVAELRFGAGFAPEVYSGYLKKTGPGDAKEAGDGTLQGIASFFTGKDGGGEQTQRYRVVRLPAADDPLVQRVNRIRSREEFLVDTLDQQYDSLARNIGDGYTKWRESRLKEMNALREVESTRNDEHMKSVAIGVLGVLAGAAIGSRTNCPSCGTAGAVIAGAAATIAVQKAIQASSQAESETKLRKTTLEELGQSLSTDVKPVVVEVEGKTVELTGTIEDKFKQWRQALKDLHQQEIGATPGPSASTAN